MKTVLLFAGTRPEIIKMAPIIRELRENVRPGLGAHFCFTGQHLDLALPFIRFFEIEPDSTLELMIPGQSLGQLTSRAADQIDGFFRGRQAAASLVQGDTTTAFVASLVSFYHGVPVGHVEAGLRTSSTREPFPEEANRRMISRLAAWHYAPTRAAQEALVAERVPAGDIVLTGNTGIDALKWCIAKDKGPVDARLAACAGKRLVLVTVHRRESIGRPIQNVVEALSRLAASFRDVQFVLPLHRNPQVAQTVEAGLKGVSNILLLDQLEYGDLVWAMKSAELILSDSGGIQEEAPTFGKPVLVLRNETERPEAIEYGTSIVVGTDPARVTAEAEKFLSGRASLKLKGPNPYGDGHAARRIVEHLFKTLG